MAAKSRRRASQAEYVTGTAARRLETERIQRNQNSQRTQSSQKLQRTRDLSHTVTVRRNREKALQMDLPYVIVLTIAAVCALYLCVSYLKLQSSITARLNHIEALEESIEQKKADNDALETRINTSVDLDYVYKVATEELGMVYANKDQVRLYNKTESEYVRQYEDIPER